MNQFNYNDLTKEQKLWLDECVLDFKEISSKINFLDMDHSHIMHDRVYHIDEETLSYESTLDESYLGYWQICVEVDPYGRRVYHHTPIKRVKEAEVVVKKWVEVN